MVFFALGLAVAPAQVQDASQNSLLNGSYRFRHVAVVNVDKTLNPSEIVASYGSITFDGAGNYVVVGSQVDNTIAGGVAQPLVVTGSYAIASNGIGYLSNPIFPGDPSAFIYGAVSQGVFSGSSTEAGFDGNNLNDIFVAIPTGNAPTTASFNTAYQVGLLDFTNAGTAALKNALFKLAPDGAGNIASFTLSGQAKNQAAVSLTQTVAGATYSFSGGAGTLTIPLPGGVTSDNALLTGARTLYQSTDGNFVLGWTATGYDILFGVKALTSPASNNTSTGLYFTAALEDCVDCYGIDSFSGATNNTGNVTGDGIVHQRISFPGGVAFDYGIDDQTVLNADGTTGNAGNGFTDLNGYQYSFGAGGQAFVAIGTKGNYVLQTGIHAANFSGSGVYLNPTGVVNAGSFQPVTASIAPGELIVLFGTGLAPSTLVTQGGQAFPTTLNGVKVTIDGLPCPIYYVTATQVAVIVPYAVADNQTGLADIQIDNNGTKSNVVQLYLTDASPGSFTANASGIGYTRALHASNAQLITPANPVQPGETISLYLTGLGTVTPGITDGAIGPSSPLSQADLYTAGNLKVFFNDYVSGSTSNLGTITYAGLVPTLGGLYQINVTLPSTGLTVGHNIYVEIATGASDINQILIPYGASATGGRAAAGPEIRAKVLAHRKAGKTIQ